MARSSKKSASPAAAASSKDHARSAALRDLIVKSLDDDKADEIASIELTGKSSIADFMVIASGRSTRQVAAMAEHLLERLKAAGHRTIGIEGKSQGDWVLVDAGDVIVHLFRPEIRGLYNLEKMWSVPPEEAAAKPARKRRPPRG